MSRRWYALGVDLGSTTAKAAVVDQDGGLRGFHVDQMGAVSRQAMSRAIAGALEAAGIVEDQVVRTISTGYGRRLVPGAERSFTEITCHARGAAAMRPGVRLVVDIGGQDSKAILVDHDGLVDRFAMNDRCASGTGRFFDVLARALEMDVAEIGPAALRGSTSLEVSSMCATFAETEVISLLAQGQEPADISASVHRSVANRTLGLIAQVGKRTPTVMTGGVAKNAAARHFLAEALGHEVEVLEEPQVAGAYGAGLLARDTHLGSLRDSADVLHEYHPGEPADCSGCDGTRGASHGPAGGRAPVSLPLGRRS